MLKRVCIGPTFRESDSGGVAVHIRSISKHLVRRGWEIAPRADGQALMHTHAMARAPQVDVYTNHGIYPVTAKMPDWQRDCNRKILDNLKLASQVIAVSRWTASRWQDLLGLSEWPAGNLHIIPNGIDLDQWRDVEHGRWRAKLGIGPDTPLVVWGKTSISEVLDPTPALELALRFPEIRVVTPLPAEVINPAPKNFIKVGPQAFAAMQMLLADADLYLATTQENHSIQLLEAMALGKPVLGYLWGGTAETLQRGDEIIGGRLATPGDLDDLAALLPEVLDRRTEYGEQGKELVAEGYQLGGLVDKLEGVYGLAQEARDAGAARLIRAKPKCSIIIPCYNKASYVAETIQSALRQQMAAGSYELLVVDDGSTDASLAVILSTLKVSEKKRQEMIGKRAAGEELVLELHDDSYSGTPVKVFARRNRGVAAARNYGITQAQGEYICCLDADDRIDPLFLTRLSAALDADPALGIAYSDMLVFGVNEQNEAFETLITCSEYDFEALKRGNLLPCCNLFRRTAWERAGGYKNINPSWEDYELWLNMGKMGWPGRRVSGGLFQYRKVPQTGRDYESQGLAWKLRAIVNSHHRDIYPPTISVVIPCYKQSDFLPEAIGSVAQQTFPDWEIVVVDDGNEAEEAAAISAIVQGWSAQGADIRLERVAVNGGLANARNTGIMAARGAWIAPLDADDWLEPGWMEAMLGATGMDPRTFAFSDSHLVWRDAAGNETRRQSLESHEYDFEELLRRVTWPCTALYAKEAWRQAGGYKPHMSDAGGWEDWEFWISLGEIGICGKRVAQKLFNYRQHSADQMRYKAEVNKPRLQETMRRLHAETYRGERSTMCCGRGNRQAQAPRQAQQQQAARGAQTPARADEGKVLVRYVGASFGTTDWRCPSGRTYKFGISAPLQQMSKSDADWLTQRKDFVAVG